MRNHSSSLPLKSVHFRARNFHHLAPFYDFGPDELGELLGRVADEVGTVGRDAIGDLGHLDDAHDLTVKLRAASARRPAAGQAATPCSCPEAVQALLVERR